VAVSGRAGGCGADAGMTGVERGRTFRRIRGLQRPSSLDFSLSRRECFGATCQIAEASIHRTAGSPWRSGRIRVGAVRVDDQPVRAVAARCAPPRGEQGYMHRPAVSTKTTQRIDRLLRSLVGVSDVRMLWRAQSLRAIHILRDAGTQPHQLVRNILSGMHAAFGITVLPTQIHIHEDASVFEAVEVAADVLVDDDDAQHSQASPKGVAVQGNGTAEANGNGAAKSHASSKQNGASRSNGNGAAPAKGGMDAKVSGSARPNGNGAHGAGGIEPALPRARPYGDADTGETIVVRPSSAPADLVTSTLELMSQRPAADTNAGLTLERIDVERRTGTLRCRTVLALGDRRYSAIAEVPDSPSAEAELAARVAVDALRAGGLTNAMLDGVGFITIGKTNYCVATVREAGIPH